MQWIIVFSLVDYLKLFYFLRNAFLHLIFFQVEDIAERGSGTGQSKLRDYESGNSQNYFSLLYKMILEDRF